MIKINLKEIMKKKRIGISELHELTGISRSTITPIYNGKSKGLQFDTLDKLLTALDVPVESLIIFIGEPPEDFEVSAKLISNSDYCINHEQVDTENSSIDMATHFQVGYSLSLRIEKKSKMKIDTKLSINAKYAFSGNMQNNNIIDQWEYINDDEFTKLIDSPIFSNEERYEITKLLNNFLLDCGINVYEEENKKTGIEFEELLINNTLYW